MNRKSATDRAYPVKFVSGGYGGTYGYRFAYLISKWADVPVEALTRDWSFQNFAFDVLTTKPFEQILDDMKSEEPSAKAYLMQSTVGAEPAEFEK